MINVTKSFLPSFEEYTSVLKRAWDKSWLTNNGELVRELELKLQEYLGVEHLLFTSNGTVVLQLALKALGITGEVITTPFSYVATTNAILWEGCSPIFVDIRPDTFCIDAEKIEAAITDRTQAILATHVYGLPCDVERIEAIAKAHGLKVIYDGAHAFGCEYKGRQLLAYGDVSTCSFHATKIFHTVEGGCIISHSPELNEKLFLMRSFGHRENDYIDIGINGKNSEFHAAMGIVNLPKVSSLIARREHLSMLYKRELLATIRTVNYEIDEYTPNYCYFPVFLKNEAQLLAVSTMLAANGINTRRYFYPSLNKLSFLTHLINCPISEHFAEVALSLPLYYDLPDEDVIRIAALINKVIEL